MLQSNEALTVAGRKRHIVVDTMGNLLGVVVHAANLHDTKLGILVARQVMAQFPTIKDFSADAGYRKSFEEMMEQEFQCPVDISEKNQRKLANYTKALSSRANFFMVESLSKISQGC